MDNPLLDGSDFLAGLSLDPAAVQIFGDEPQLDDQLTREVQTCLLTALLPPECEERLLVLAHDDPGIGAADEAPSIRAKRLS